MPSAESTGGVSLQELRREAKKFGVNIEGKSKADAVEALVAAGWTPENEADSKGGFGMTLPELRREANKLGVEIGQCRDKAEVVELLVGAGWIPDAPPEAPPPPPKSAAPPKRPPSSGKGK
eukprot:Hpha_TRINITY_DN22814_c0_g1::TRINITY_DN22814_c0_g1_i1::g.84400::m.84400